MHDMPVNDGVFLVPEMGTDARVRVFRRYITGMEDFEGMEVDAYVVITSNYVVVFDTMLCPEDANFMMQMVQDQLAGRQILVVNSHADWDHSWGNGYFTGEHAAPIIAHEHCLVRMKSEEARAGLADYQSRYPVFRNVVLVPPTITFKSDLTISGGDLSIELIPAPGHHPDHIAAWIPPLSLLLAFDAVEKPLPCIEDTASVPSMFTTLESFLTLQPERVLCSHGKTTSLEAVKENLAYLREIERRGRDLLQRHHPTNEELEHAAETIHYSLDDVIAGTSEAVDRTFYGWAHNANARYILQWLARNPTSEGQGEPTHP
jgi:glyoxylase-like metal-dependent hydrolase (beta-lactamase superfamily II)